ncbi:M56 family metallopeptidase [Acidicapsa dinghuensis]|uniref:M56 family metallopeptidase n=1 Tax=Acidicapsa dinghuensis TaxID=2218256 RepID=A0ABW1EGH3_9BACT|nr:M56 family metallopeptidase [Acidicapsa dinghuensis]
MTAAAWSLIHLLWQQTLLALALAAALKIAEKHTANLRYLLCCTALCIVVLCPFLTWATFDLWPSHTIHEQSTAGLDSTGLAIHSETQTTAHTTLPAALTLLIAWINYRIATILILWSIGVLLITARILTSLYAVHRLRTTQISPAPDRLQSVLRQLVHRLGIATPIQLLISSGTTTPAVVGWQKPAILLPSTFLDGLSPQQEQVILIHELAHIQRHDYLVNLLQSIVEALFFYHPATWWLSRQIRREREFCCDETAANLSESALVYAKALTILEERRLPAKPQLSLGVHGGDLSMRIKHLFKQSPKASLDRKSGISLAILGMLTLAAVTILSITATNRVNAQATATMQQSQFKPLSAASYPPNMDCSYYGWKDKKFVPQDGLCEASSTEPETYLCRQKDGEKQSQIQSGCKWKVQRMQEWQRQQQNQSK